MKIDQDLMVCICDALDLRLDGVELDHTGVERYDISTHGNHDICTYSTLGDAVLLVWGSCITKRNTATRKVAVRQPISRTPRGRVLELYAACAGLVLIKSADGDGWQHKGTHLRRKREAMAYIRGVLQQQ